jgi:hypothetical protein
MKVFAQRKSEQNHAIVDPWTVVHFSTGLALGLMNIPFGRSMAAAVAYEGIEQIFERHPVGQEIFVTHGPEAPANAVLDVAVFALGHYLGARWNRG